MCGGLNGEMIMMIIDIYKMVIGFYKYGEGVVCVVLICIFLLIFFVVYFCVVNKLFVGDQ